MEDTPRQASANQHQKSRRLRYAGRPDSNGASGKRAKIAVSVVEKIKHRILHDLAVSRRLFEVTFRLALALSSGCILAEQCVVGVGSRNENWRNWSY
jgi:hypothetical protein